MGRVRVLALAVGGFYGWLAPQRADFWRLPPYFIDVMPPLAYLGRGSPTGVVCYRHSQFPRAYRGGMFLCDWTFGKVYFASLERRRRWPWLLALGLGLWAAPLYREFAGLTSLLIWFLEAQRRRWRSGSG